MTDLRFETTEAVRHMTWEEARRVLVAAAVNLHNHLTPDTCHTISPRIQIPEPHGFHSDDGSDDLTAATDAWTGLWEIWMAEDGRAGVERKVAGYLLSEPMGGVDGELRFQIFGPEVEWDGQEKEG